MRKTLLLLAGLSCLIGFAANPLAGGHCRYNGLAPREIEASSTTALLDQIAASPAAIVLVQDLHNLKEIRAKLSQADFAKKLYELGFRNYVIEAPATDAMNAFLNKYNQNEFVRLDSAPEPLGPMAFANGDPGYRNLVDSMHKAKLSVIALDHPHQSAGYLGKILTREEREGWLESRLTNISKGEGRTLVLIGAAHAQFAVEGQPLKLGIDSLADRLAKDRQSVLSVRFKL